MRNFLINLHINDTKQKFQAIWEPEKKAFMEREKKKVKIYREEKIDNEAIKLMIMKKSESFGSANSINISSIPPLEDLSITEGWNGELKAPYSIENKESYIQSGISESDCKVENNYKEDHLLKEENKISLRIIDWFVTNYSKKNNIY